MRLPLIRHAPAIRNGSAGIRDPDVLLTSLLARARATAEIAAAAFKNVTPRGRPPLLRSPGGA